MYIADEHRIPDEVRSGLIALIGMEPERTEKWQVKCLHNHERQKPGYTSTRIQMGWTDSVISMTQF